MLPFRSAPLREDRPPPRWIPWAAAAALVVLGVGGSAAVLVLRHHRGRSVSADLGVERTFSRRVARGALTVRVGAIATAVTVQRGRDGEVRAHVRAPHDESVRLRDDGDGALRVEVLGGNRASSLRVEVPAGAALDVTTTSGDIVVADVGAGLTVRTTSGDVSVRGAAATTVTSVSGDVEVRSSRGALRATTTSGALRVESADAAPDVEAQTVSGDVAWSGRCGEGCQLALRTVSGDVALTLAPEVQAQGFRLGFATMSGRVDDDVDAAVTRPDADGHVTGVVGAGAGRVRCETSSGDLSLRWLER